MFDDDLRPHLFTRRWRLQMTSRVSGTESRDAAAVAGAGPRSTERRV